MQNAVGHRVEPEVVDEQPVQIFFDEPISLRAETFICAGDGKFSQTTLHTARRDFEPCDNFAPDNLVENFHVVEIRSRLTIRDGDFQCAQHVADNFGEVVLAEQC